MNFSAFILPVVLGLTQVAGSAAEPARTVPGAKPAVKKAATKEVAVKKAAAAPKAAVAKKKTTAAAAKKKTTAAAAKKKTTAAAAKTTPKKTIATAAKTAVPKTTAKAVPKKTAKKVVRKPKAAPPDPTEGDNVDGEDLAIRRAAVAALGKLNGAVVAVDPSTGRVLTMVNQKLALQSGFIPCSTIKLVTALAALNEDLIDRSTYVRLSRKESFNLTTALAHSNNQFFQRLGNQLGFERVSYYAHMLGLGEKAGLDIAGEKPGVWPAQPPKAGGVGMMTAYGQEILMTPLELAALLSAIANGGTLYHLQSPKTLEEAEEFTPRVKRTLDLSAGNIEDVKVGMRGAVDFGTARRASYDPNEPILGKTGTCTDFRMSSHMGWFGSFNEVDHHQLVVVVMLMGSKTVTGPVASGVAGAIYRSLSEQKYFVAEGKTPTDSTGPLLVSACCSQ